MCNAMRAVDDTDASAAVRATLQANLHGGDPGAL